MRCLSLAMILCATTALAQETTPFAQQPYRAGDAQPALLSLGDMMTISQIRHIKAWQAAKAENWRLAAYEAEKLRESLYRAAVLYVNIPAPLVRAAEQPLGAMAEASAKRDLRAFEKSFAELTASCNACHEAAGLGFVRMRTPSSSPFTNQDYTRARQ